MLERVGDRFVDVREEDDHSADGWVLKFYDLTPFQEVALFLCEFHDFIFKFDHGAGNRFSCLSAPPSPFWPASGKPRCVDRSGRAVRV